MNHNNISIGGNNNVIVQDAQGSQIYFQIHEEQKNKKLLTPPPFIPELFIGRDEDLELIYQKLFKDDNLLLLVNGEGGIGKTTLAAKYWDRYQQEYSHVAWIFVGNNLLESLLTLAHALNLTFPDQTPNQERLPILIRALNNLSKPCLMIIDNINDPDELENNYLALRSCTNFHLLITTRITEFEHALYHEIQPLDTSFAIDLFQRHYPKYKSSEQPFLELILIAVGYNTLVIELLAKNLRNLNKLREQYSLNDLLNDLQSKGILALRKSEDVKVGYQSKNFGLRQEKPEAIIEAMYDLGELQDKEKQLLSVFAVLPAERIPLQIIEELLPGFEDLDTHILALFQTGWLDFQEEDSTLKISPVVQAIVRLKNKSLREDCETLIQSLIEQLGCDETVDEFINSSYAKASKMASYAVTIILHCLEFDRGLARLAKSLGLFFQIARNWESSEKYNTKALEYFNEQLLMNQDGTKAILDCFACKYHLARTLQLSGKFQKSLALSLELLDINEQLCVKEPANLDYKQHKAILYERIAQNNNFLGQKEDALSYFNQQTQLFEELCLIEPNNSTFRLHLSISYGHLGDFGDTVEAIQYCEKSLNIVEKLVAQYPEKYKYKNRITSLYIKLSKLYLAQNNQERAAIFIQKFATISEELNEYDPNNFVAQLHLSDGYEQQARYYDSLGDSFKTIEYYEKGIEVSKKMVENYPADDAVKLLLANDYNALAKIHVKQNNFQEAISLFGQAMSEYKKLPIDSFLIKDYISFCFTWGGIFQEYNYSELRLSCLLEIQDIVTHNMHIPNLKTHETLAISYIGTAEYYQGELQHLKAEQDYLKAVKLFEQLMQESQITPTAGDLMMHCFDQLVNINRNHDNDSMVLFYELEKINTLTVLCNQGSTNYADLLLNSYFDLVTMLKTTEAIKSARNHINKYYILASQVYFREKESLTGQLHLLSAASILGFSYECENKQNEALKYYSQPLITLKGVQNANKKFVEGIFLCFLQAIRVSLKKKNLSRALEFYNDLTDLVGQTDFNWLTAVNLSYLANSQSLIGDHYLSIGDLFQAESYFLESLEALKKSSAIIDTDKTTKENLIKILGKIKQLYLSQNELGQSLSYHYAHSFAINQMVKAYPDEETYTAELAQSFIELGGLLHKLNEIKAGSNFTISAIKYLIKLTQNHPDNTSYRNNLAVGYEQLGTIYFTQGQYSTALKLYSSQNQLFKKLNADFPDYELFKSSLSISIQKLISTYKPLGDHSTIAELYNQLIHLVNELREEYPDKVDYIARLAEAYTDFAIFSKENLELLYRLIQMAEPLWAALVVRYPDNSYFTNKHDDINELIKSLKKYEL